jgi:hypothetical protein
MTHPKLIVMSLGISLLLGCVVSPEPSPPLAEPMRWLAMSRTATAITGDIALDNHTIVFQNGAQIQIKAIENRSADGLTLYRVLSRTNPELLNGNTLCASEPVDYLTVQMSSREMSLTVYRYPDELVLAQLPLPTTASPERSLCAIYNYTAPNIL